MPYSSRRSGRNTERSSVSPSCSTSLIIFDRRSVRLHRDRAASSPPRHDFLLREIGERLVDRLDDVRRKFPLPSISAVVTALRERPRGARCGGAGSV